MRRYRVLPEILSETIASLYSHLPCIGVLMVVQKPGIIRVGDVIMAEKETSD